MASPGGPPSKSVTVYEGDAFVEVVSFVDASGNPLDVSGYTWIAPQLRDMADGSEICTMTLDVSNAEGGAITVTIPSASTTGWADGSGDPVTEATFDLRCTDIEGNLRTVGVWICTLQQQVTQV